MLTIIINYERKLHNLRIMVVESVHVLVNMLSNKYIVDLVYPICLEVSMINVICFLSVLAFDNFGLDYYSKFCSLSMLKKYTCMSFAIWLCNSSY